MNATTSTSSIGEVRITLRDDIHFQPQQYGGESCYVIGDPTNSSFYRVGVPEYTLISMFDGSLTIRDAMYHASSVLGRNAFTEQDAASIGRWLVDCGLAKTNTSTESHRLHKKSDEQATQARQQWMNPIMAKVPIFCPERALDRVSPFLLWMTSTPAFLVWCFVLCVAGHQLFTHWEQLSFDSSSILSPHNWLWLGVTWLALKFVHETFHALFCRKYSGTVREAGVVLIALAPIFYVDVTSSWKFHSKWQRIAVAAAGMYSELFIGAVASLVWVHTEPGTVNQIALNVLLLSTVTTILFNANPLMRFDGYYILSDFFEIPNLAPQGQEYLSYVGRRYLYGVDVSCPVGGWTEGWAIRSYGVAAMFWRILITVSIALMAATLFHGAGLALVVIGSVFWICVPIYKNGKYFIYGRDQEQPKRLRTVCVWGSAIAIVTLGCLYSPWPFAVKAPAVVDYEPRGTVRVASGGFANRILVRSGDDVEQGQLLAVLENVELIAEVRRLRASLAASKTRVRVSGQNSDVTGQQLEHETTINIELQLAERMNQVEQLAVRAPMAGRVVSEDLDALVGTYFNEGQELLVIGDESKKELVVSISQDDAELFNAQTGKDVTVKLRGGVREKLSLSMGAVEPGASTNIEHVAITAAAGGCVAVRPKTIASNDDQSWEFVEPRLAGSIKLSQEESERLRAGQLAMVKLPVARSTLGEGIYRATERWLRAKWRTIQDVQRSS